MFDPNKKWSPEEIQELINQEHPLECIVNKYTLEELLEENPDYKRKMLEEQKRKAKFDFFTCPHCNKKMPEKSKDLHDKYCKKKEK